MKVSFKSALQSLKAGNERFVTGNLLPKDTYTEDRKALCEGQYPFAVVLCCSDSRVAPEIIFDQKLGEPSSAGFAIQPCRNLSVYNPIL